MAIIINKNHTVITYLVNGRPQHIVERVAPDSEASMIVAQVKRESSCGDEWDKVYNAVDAYVEVMTPQLERAIDRLSY